MSYQDPPNDRGLMAYVMIGIVVLVILMSLVSLISVIREGSQGVPTWVPAAVCTATPQGMATQTPEGWWDQLATPTPIPTSGGK